MRLGIVKILYLNTGFCLKKGAFFEYDFFVVPFNFFPGKHLRVSIKGNSANLYNMIIINTLQGA